MRGRFNLIVQSNEFTYYIPLERNITILRGDSATGKTTFFQIVHSALMKHDPYTIIDCELQVVTIVDSKVFTNEDFPESTLLIFDEDVPILSRKFFASRLQKLGCYALLITRNSYSNIPYAITSVLELKFSDNKYFATPIYKTAVNNNNIKSIISEDSDSGNKYWSSILNTQVKPGYGAATLLSEMSNDSLAIVDNSAFGAYIDVLMTKFVKHGASYFAPESVEYFILQALFKSEVNDLLDGHEIDSKQYKHWEPYFTELLQKLGVDKHFVYSKHHLPDEFISSEALDAARAKLPEFLSLYWLKTFASDRGFSPIECRNYLQQLYGNKSLSQYYDLLKSDGLL